MIQAQKGLIDTIVEAYNAVYQTGVRPPVSLIHLFTAIW